MTILGRLRRVVMDFSWLWLPKDNKKVVHTNINGYALLVLANEDVGRTILYDRKFEDADVRFLANAIPDDAVCVDVGANVGYFTMLFAKLSPRGNVYAFEPLQLNGSLLRASAALNRYDNIEIFEVAMGDATGETSLTQSSDGAYSSIIDTKRAPAERTVTVGLTTLDHFVESKGIFRIDVLKIDVEGAETLVVAGGARTLQDASRRPRIILMELCEKNLEVFGSTSKNLLDTMASFGYTAHVNDDDGLRRLDGERLGPTGNVVFLAPDPALPLRHPDRLG